MQSHHAPKSIYPKTPDMCATELTVAHQFQSNDEMIRACRKVAESYVADGMTYSALAKDLANLVACFFEEIYGPDYYWSVCSDEWDRVDWDEIAQTFFAEHVRGGRL